MNTMYLAQFLTVIVIHFLAVASPGPDFLIVTKNNLTAGRKAGIYTTLGIKVALASNNK
jgi:threonine/homoserine/homoserine lactone efflux protein